MTMPWAMMVICTATLLATAAVAQYDGEQWLTRGAGGKQGPLLMMDAMQQSLERFVAGAEAVGDTAAIDGWLDAAEQPEQWALPDPAQPDSDAHWIFTPPMPRGCNNSARGSGEAVVNAGDHRGIFDIDLRSGTGQYAYSIASPCLVFTPPRDGRVRARVAVVVDGVAAAEAQRQGTTAAWMGVWIAHCHPKERGRYSLRTGWDSGGMAGGVRFDQYVLLHEAEFPVQEGIEHLFGAGIAAACASKDGAVGMRLWGRVAWLTVEMI